VNLGVAAHINAASPGGPRYRSDLTDRQRHSAANGIWLCQIHAKEVDNDEAVFPEHLLRVWKQLAETDAAQELNSAFLQPARAAALRLEHLRRPDYNSPAQRYEDRLVIRVTIRGTVPVRGYFLEVRVPKGLVEQPQNYAHFSRSRSTDDYDFFFRSNGPKEVLYPDHEQDLFTCTVVSGRANPGGLPIRVRFVPEGLPPSESSLTYTPSA